MRILRLFRITIIIVSQVVFNVQRYIVRLYFRNVHFAGVVISDRVIRYRLVGFFVAVEGDTLVEIRRSAFGRV